jgi:hypothetical protein
MRRPTLIVIIALFVLLTIATIVQITIASHDSPPLPGPTSPGQLPSFSSTPSPAP